jgi:hypothetical protein
MFAGMFAGMLQISIAKCILYYFVQVTFVQVTFESSLLLNLEAFLF